MPRTITEHRCLVISPGDVTKEREAVVDVIHRWNASVGGNRGIRVEPVHWETHTYPDMSGPAQAQVNEQIVDECDFGIAIFWSRVGTPTAEYGSGSIEEVERLAERGAKVMLYKSTRPIPVNILDTRQIEKLNGLLEQYRQRGLLGQFSTVTELRELVNKDLSLLLGRQHNHTTSITPPEVETAARPDIRVKVRVMVSPLPEGGLQRMLQITVENHSPRPFFLSSIGMSLVDGHGLWFRRDSLFNVPNAPQTIESGNSHSLHVFAEDFAKFATSQIVCAEAYDKIARVFSSDPEETRRAVDSLMNPQVAGDAG